ncbi:MAG: hypothetical protein H3C62_15850 [Gemmatimonadaceae bacterium]|nr:hypothetical protein [Gemmatimonadaceae bacterium]
MSEETLAWLKSCKSHPAFADDDKHAAEALAALEYCASLSRPPVDWPEREEDVAHFRRRLHPNENCAGSKGGRCVPCARLVRLLSALEGQQREGK